MRYTLLTVPALALAIAGAMPTKPAAAAAAAACPAVDQQALGSPYVYRHGLPGKTLEKDFFSATGLKGKGYRPRRLTGYLAGGKQRFATRWVKAAGGPWSGRFGPPRRRVQRLAEEVPRLLPRDEVGRLPTAGRQRLQHEIG